MTGAYRSRLFLVGGGFFMARPQIREEVLRWARRHLEVNPDPAEVAEHVHAFIRRQPALGAKLLSDAVSLPEPTRLYLLWVALLVERMFLVQYGDVATPVSVEQTQHVREAVELRLRRLSGVHTRFLLRRSENGRDFRQPVVLKLLVEALGSEQLSRVTGIVLDERDTHRALVMLDTVSEAFDEAVSCGLDLRESRRQAYALMSPTELFRELELYARFPPKELLVRMLELEDALTDMLLPWVEALAWDPWAKDLPGYGWGPVHAMRLLSSWRVEAALDDILTVLDAATASSAPGPDDDPRDLPLELVDALLRYGEVAFEPVLEAIRVQGPGRPYRRRELVLVTVATSLGVLDPRVRALLDACHDRDPAWWAERVAAYGDRSLLPLLRARLRRPRRRTGELLNPEEVEAVRAAIDSLETQEGPPVPFQSDILAFYNRRVAPGRDEDPTNDPELRRLLTETGIAAHLLRCEPPVAYEKVPELRLLLPDDDS